jgi:hypothetical protein
MAKFDGGTPPGVHHWGAAEVSRAAPTLWASATKHSCAATSAPVETRSALPITGVQSSALGGDAAASGVPVARWLGWEHYRHHAAGNRRNPDRRRRSAPRCKRRRAVGRGARCSTASSIADGRPAAIRIRCRFGIPGRWGYPAARRSCARFSGARPEWRARWHRARPWRRFGMAGSTPHPSGSHLTGQEAADRDRGQDRDRNRIDKCGLVQAVVRCSDASEHGRNASCQVTDDVDRSD